MTHPPEPKHNHEKLASFYRYQLLENVIPFWMSHGLDTKYGGIITSLDRAGNTLDTDKSVWFQGRAGWMFATLYNTIEPSPEWLEAARSCTEFSRKYCHSPEGKMWFTVTQAGAPLRMRRYVFSEAFASISYAAFAKATGDPELVTSATKAFATFLHFSFTPGVMPPKYESTRPEKAIGPHMIGIATAQELRDNLGDVQISGKTCTEWIDWNISEIIRYFVKPEHEALMEVVGQDGTVLNHHAGRTLNPGHALECAWFIMHEGSSRNNSAYIKLGLQILDWMWERGWDTEFGGLFYYRDLHNLPVQEYWHDMKFWWPHCEAIIATLLAWSLTGAPKYERLHSLAHDWSFKHFPDPIYGEWYGYLRRDGTISQPAKGNMFKGPFHLPRMLWYCAGLLDRQN